MINQRRSVNTRRSLFVLIIIVLFVFLVIGISFFIYNRSKKDSDSSTSIVELWNQKQYKQVLEKTEDQLDIHPLDPIALFFNGITNYYIGISKNNTEDQLYYINKSIFSLNNSLLSLPNKLIAQAHYILGKAYFQKGKFYSDLAIKHLNYSKEKGYTADDLLETIGIAYFNAGSMKQSLDYLLNVDKSKPTGMLAYKLGEIYSSLDNTEMALSYYEKSIERSNDFSLEEKAYFAKGLVYFNLKDWSEAKKALLKVIELNPNNIEGHFTLGEIYNSEGNRVKARSEWFKTFRLDNNHYKARLRLFG
ncbi:tetratricopeptide repeat protein [Spirochaeta cellobiosiphila]|uniref:tetratricopeptide repeat protein n=1 Tax=Spirochaeta cellobiosiphila TaxID=504483 RepID=UPI000415D80E|nr:tetratricopeptide repeat protein [Spirochaeta cellobiosiphila]